MGADVLVGLKEPGHNNHDIGNVGTKLNQSQHVKG